MAVRPLRPATDRRLGRPLPHQQANRTRVPLQAPGPKIPDFDHHPSKGGILCGISPPFGRLSPARRQVTHALLTRLPLYSQPEGYFRVRLACIRHAASVDSEPGSNSQVKDVASGNSLELPSDNFNRRAMMALGCSDWFVRLILDECASSSYLVVKEPTPNQVGLAPPCQDFLPQGNLIRLSQEALLSMSYFKSDGFLSSSLYLNLWWKSMDGRTVVPEPPYAFQPATRKVKRSPRWVYSGPGPVRRQS